MKLAIILMLIFGANAHAATQIFENDRFSYDAAALLVEGIEHPVVVSGTTVAPTDLRFTALHVVVLQDLIEPIDIIADTFTHQVTTDFISLGLVGDFGAVTFSGGPGLTVLTGLPFGHNLQVIPEPTTVVLLGVSLILILWRPKTHRPGCK